MTAVSKSTAKTDIAASFPDNTTGLITPTAARTMLNEMVDSWVDTLLPGASTGSIVFWSDASSPTALVIGAAGAILQAGATAPSWLAPGARGSLLFETTASSAAWLALGTTGSILQPAGGTAPAWTTGPVIGQPGTTPGTLGIAGSNSTSTVTLAANASGASWTMRMPTSGGTNRFLLSTDGSGVTSWVNAGQIPGDTTGVAASSGNMGEVVSSFVAIGSAVPLNGGATASNITSISLPAGDWDINGNIASTVSATCAIVFIEIGLGTTSATLAGRGSNANSFENFGGGAGTNNGLNVGPAQFNVSTTTTVFLVGSFQYASGTASGYGGLAARRRR